MEQHAPPPSPAGFTITPLSSSLFKRMLKPTNIIIAGLSVTLFGFSIALFTRPAHLVEQAVAEWPIEAKTLAESIANDMEEYERGTKMINEGSAMVSKAAAAAKGKDLVLCADFQARFDRTTGQLVADAQCPLF